MADSVPELPSSTMITTNVSTSPVGVALRQFFARHAIGPCRLVAAVSGGADSTALLLALSDLRNDGFELTAAHVNHSLRGVESEEDEVFVRELCGRLGVPFVRAGGSLPPAAVRRWGVEGAARVVRYERLEAIRTGLQADFVATAHQRDDQAETVLMRLIRGTGLAGLRGIHPIRSDQVIRPLLQVGRADIESFLLECGVTPREDSMNRDARYLRTRVRSLLANGPAAGQLLEIAALAGKTWPLVEALLEAEERRLLALTPDSTTFLGWPENSWLRCALLHRQIRRLDPDASGLGTRALTRLASGAQTRVAVTRHLELRRAGQTWVLKRKAGATPPFAFPLSPGEPIHLPLLGIRIGVAPASASSSSGRQKLLLPAGASPRFVVRNRRAGDRFQPLGMQRSKKLKDLLIDRKIPVEVRDRLPLLVWNDEIVWVAGVEISERFKVVVGSSGTLYEAWTEDWGARDDDRDRAGFHG